MSGSPLVIASREVGRRRPRALRRVALAALTATVALAFSPFMAVISPLAAVAFAGVAVAAFFGCVVAVLVIEGRDEPRPGAMSLDDAGVELSTEGGTVKLRRGELTEGKVVPRHGGGRWVELSAGDVAWRVRVDDVEAAHAALERLGLGPTRKAMRLELGSRLFRWVGALAWAVLAALVTSTLTSLLLVVTGAARGEAALWIVTVATVGGALGAALRAAASFGPRAAVVGSDGITLEGVGFLGERKFIGYGEVERVERARGVIVSRDGGVLRVTLKSGEVVGVGQEQDDVEALAALEEHLRRGVGARREDGGEVVTAAMLRREGRDVAAWREGLKAKVMGPAFRGSGIDPEGLLRVAEDGESGAEARVGAVLALRGMTEGEGGDDVRTRVRVVIESCADEGVRDAMSAAMEDRLDDAGLAAVTAAERRR